MVQYFKSSPDPRDAASGALASALGQGLAKGINSYNINRSLQSVMQDKSLKTRPLSERMEAFQTALSPYGDEGRQYLQDVMMRENQFEQEKQLKLEQKKGTVLKKILNDEPVSEEDRDLFTAQEELGIAKHKQALELQQLKNQGKAPPGGVGAQPVPAEIGNKIKKIIEENPNANSDELGIKFDESGVPTGNSNRYVENRRRQDEQKTKVEDEKTRALRQETLPLRKQIAEKATAASEGIKNKEHLLNLIEKGDINDPTFAALAESLPLNLGKRMLSDDTVEYKAGIIDEFKDLRNIFPGQVRVKEIELLEQKMADLYLTDTQKKSILNSRINALRADVIRAEAAEEIENEPLGVLQFQKEVEKRAQPRLDALFNQILDEQKSIIQNAENRKNIPLDLNDADDKKIAEEILKEAKGNRNKAREIAKKKGYAF